MLAAPLPLFLLSGGALFVVILIFLACRKAPEDKREECPACKLQSLSCVHFILATVVINGQRAPDCWAYYRCEACNAHFKKHKAVFKPVDDAEWGRYCKHVSNVPSS